MSMKNFSRGDPIDMNQKAIKNVLPPTEEGDAATKGYVDSKSVGESDLDMNGNSVRHTNPTLIHEDEVVPKQWIENNILSRNSPASTMPRNLNKDGHNISYLRAPEQTTTQRQKDMQIRSSHVWVETCKVELEWLETEFHTWVSLFRAMTQSDRVQQTNSF